MVILTKIQESHVRDSLMKNKINGLSSINCLVYLRMILKKDR